MEKKRKEHIDGLWKDTLYGQWVLATASGETEKAYALMEKIANKPPFGLSESKRELSTIIAKEMNDESELDEYMKALDDENYDLVGFMISNDTFGIVYDILSGRQHPQKQKER